jgi:hypothetical protein
MFVVGQKGHAAEQQHSDAKADNRRDQVLRPIRQ